MNRRQLLTAGGVTALVIGAWFLLFWSPKSDQLAQAKDRQATAELEAENLELRLAGLLAAKKDEAALAAKGDRLTKAVPSDASVADFILQANAAAAEAGVEFVSITPTPPAPSTTPGVAAQIGLSLQVSGGYFRMLDYLDSLLALDRIVVLDSVSVTPSGEEGATELSVSLTGRMFMSQLPTSAAAPGAVPPTTTTVPSNQVAAASTTGAGS